MSYLPRIKRLQQVQRVDLLTRLPDGEGEMEPDSNYRPCAWCGDEYRWTLQSYTGPARELGDHYCTERCRRAAIQDAVKMAIPCGNGNCKNTVLLPSDGSAFFWSARTGYEFRELYCAECNPRFNAPLIKPQPQGTRIDGWDV